MYSRSGEDLRATIEQEEREVQEMKKHAFHAKPLNHVIMNKRGRMNHFGDFS